MGSIPPRRRALLLGAASAAVLAAAPARAQSPYPDRPVRVIVGLQAGASTDTLARTLARRLSERLGQQVIVENRPGAATRIGMEALARAPADGYTLAVANAVSTSFPLMFDGFEFAPGKDFAPVSMLGRAPSYLAVRASLPVRDAREFVAYAKANDGKIAFGQGGNGSNPHLAALTLLRSLGVRGVEVAYKGNAPAAVALAAGEIDFAMLDLAAVRPMVEGGKVRLLAVTEPKRAGLTPDVPTSGEQGLTRELDGVTPWFMLVAPAGTPAAIVALLNRHVDQVMREPEVRQSLVASGIEPESGTPGEAQAYFLKQREHVARLVGDLRVSLRQ
jgi:tripartite-type tricarboxylate transporter receptor subunit TctC